MTLMARTIAAAGRRGLRRVGVAVFLAAVFGVPANAAATLRIENHNSPAGDPTPITYFLENANWSAPIQFVLRDGQWTPYGPDPGTYTVRAAVPAGWKVLAINCIGPVPQNFTVDVTNARVTMIHAADDEQTCAFTVGKAGSGSSGVSPSPPASELPKVKVPRRAALLGVRVGRGYAEVDLRLIRRSVVKLKLLRGKKVLARKLAIRRRGTREVRIALPAEIRERLRERGRKRVALTLKVRVVPRKGKAKVFWHRAIVPL
jgi:hypothetical protein